MSPVPAYKISLAYNIFNLGIVTELLLTSDNNGWINENVFVGGRIETLTVNGSYQHNNNHFYNPCLEGSTVQFNTGMHNYIHNARFESCNLVQFAEKTFGNVIEQNYFGYRSVIYGECPSWFSDLSGNNYYKYSMSDAYKVFNKHLDVNSYNYNINALTPTQDGKLQTQVWQEFYRTEIISIEKFVSIFAKTDIDAFRVSIICYDENKNLITQEPSICPIIGTYSTWTTNAYSLGSSDAHETSFLASRHSEDNAELGSLSNVCYIQIVFSASGAAPKIDYFDITVATSFINDKVNNPLGDNVLTATSIPTTTYCQDGVVAHNRDATKSLLGWFFNNGAWHPVGEYQ